MARRKNQQRERRLISEYVLERVFPTRSQLNVALGPPEPELVEVYGLEEALRIARPWRFEADLVVFHPDRVDVVEAKILSVIDGIAKLPIYAGLVASTPELAHVAGLPVRTVLVTPWSAPHVELAARTVGVEVEVFRPDWVIEYVHDLHEYWTAPWRARRQERARILEAFGLE